MYTTDDATNDIREAVANGVTDAEVEAQAVRQRQEVLAAQLASLVNMAILERNAALDPADHGDPISAWYDNAGCVILWADGYTFRLHGYESKLSRYEVEKMINITSERNGHVLSKFAYSTSEDFEHIARCENCRQLVAYSDKNPIEISGKFYNDLCPKM